MTKIALKKYIALILLMFLFVPVIILGLGSLILIPANDLNWLEGWLFIFAFLGYFELYYVYFLIKDPQTLLNRSKQSSESSNVIYTVVAVLLFIQILIFPGLNRQFLPNLLPLPFAIEIVGFIGLIVGFFISFLANRENTYASKGVRIHEGHQVITTGPYAVIRHPMYAGFFIMFISMPISLGSVVGILPSILIIVATLLRIRWEEDQLLRELADYLEYTKKVRYKIIPKIY